MVSVSSGRDSELVDRLSAKQKHAFPGSLWGASEQRVFIFCANSSVARARKFGQRVHSSDRGERRLMKLTVSLTKFHLLDIEKCGKRLQFRVVEAASSFMLSQIQGDFASLGEELHCAKRGNIQNIENLQIFAFRLLLFKLIP
jgi:hypothetical protein